MFDLDQIKSKTSIRQLDFHHQLGSTNDRAIELIQLGQMASPAIILTENQTQGRGQRARKWWSDTGSLTFSYVFQTKASPPGELSSLTSLSVAESIESQTELTNIEIKWPNDLILKNQKLAGILIETIPVDQTYFTIIGIGINVNNEIDPSLIDALEDRDKTQPTLHSPLRPTSLQMELGTKVELTQLLVEFINRIEKNLIGSPELLKRINDRLAFRGEPIQIKRASGEVISGTCHAISKNGELVLQTENGLQKIYSGNVERF